MDSFFIMLCLVALAGIVVCALTGVWVIIQRIISYRKGIINSESNDRESSETVFEVNQSDKSSINKSTNKSYNLFFRGNSSIRFAIVGVIIVILLIPLSFFT